MPYTSKYEWKLDLFNEFIILIINYFLMCFTKFVPSQDAQSNMGLILILVTSFMLMTNLGPIFFS
jgi:hypothetical protein